MLRGSCLLNYNTNPLSTALSTLTFPAEPGDVVGLALAVPVEIGVLDAGLAGGAVALVGGVVLDARDDLLLAGHPVADEGPDAGVVLGVHARLAAVSEGGKDSDDTGLA